VFRVAGSGFAPCAVLGSVGWALGGVSSIAIVVHLFSFLAIVVHLFFASCPVFVVRFFVASRLVVLAIIIVEELVGVEPCVRCGRGRIWFRAGDRGLGASGARGRGLAGGCRGVLGLG
jgi:hypothetical protein